MESVELTILMPCLNEAETIASCISKAQRFLSAENIQGEILIADNGSTDGSRDIAISHGARVISVPTKGYGAVLKSGIAAAQGKFVIMGDADDSYDFFSLSPFIAKLREGYDLVMGNRFKGGILQGAMPLLNRYLGNPVLSWLGRIFFKSNIGDFHCGLRGFNRTSLQQLQLQGDGMEFASEMVVKATLKNFKITEVPTQLHPDGRSRRPHLRPWRDGWRHLRLLLLFSPRWLFLYPGMFLLTLGCILMSLLIFGPVQIGNVNFDIHTMLFCTLFMTAGLQGICFGSFANQVANFHMKLPVKNKTYFTLEYGLIIGVVCIVSGLLGSSYTFWYWYRQLFGPLIPTQMMRILIPSITLIMLGMQLVFTSFFASLLDWHYHADEMPKCIP